MEHWIYLDHAATTPVHPEVLAGMQPYFTESFGNPSGFSSFSDPSKAAIDQARETVAKFLGADPGEIYFTGGGTEADNWALKATAYAKRSKGNHIITSKIEHHAVLHTCAYLETLGFEVTYVKVDENGILDLQELEAAIRPTTILISVMTANNEIGTIQPIEEIGAIARTHPILNHTDAVPAYGPNPIDVHAQQLELLSASGHKINGPKGVGILYARKGSGLGSFLHGGAQEKGKRAGTYNTPGIVGFGLATALAQQTLEARAARETELRDYLIGRILEEIPYCRLNGSREHRLPNNANFSFQYIEGESMRMPLAQNKICAASGAACTSGSLDPSHVLLAIGLPHEIAHGSLRLTLSDAISESDLDYTVETLKQIVARLRAMSPLYEDFLKGRNATHV